MLSVGVAILFAEGLVRLFAPAWLWRYRDATADWRRDPELGWTQKPNLDVKSRIPGRDWIVRFQTNPDGITPAVARRRRQPGTRRIMIFGNSTVLGRSVPRDRTVTKQLERLLNRCGVKTEVINAGVQGYSTDQVLLHIQRLAPLYRPDIVMYGFCLNDLGGIGLRRAYGLPKPMFMTRARDQLELLPPELDRSSIPSFGRGPRKWLQFSALYRLLQPRILLIRSQMMSWEERNLLGLPDEIYYRGLARRHANGELFAALLKRMSIVCRENGARFFFYSHPSIQEVWDPYIRRVQTQFAWRQGSTIATPLRTSSSRRRKKSQWAFALLLTTLFHNRIEGRFTCCPVTRTATRPVTACKPRRSLDSYAHRGPSPIGDRLPSGCATMRPVPPSGDLGKLPVRGKSVVSPNFNAHAFGVGPDPVQINGRPAVRHGYAAIQTHQGRSEVDGPAATLDVGRTIDLIDQVLPVSWEND